MKGDFSRLTFDPRKHYTAVLQQQGRAQLDSDWNEQAEIAAHLRETLVVDLIGGCAAPARGGGFKVTGKADGDLLLSPGRIYVGGLLCELETETTYLRQPHLPKPPPIEPCDGRTDLLYLDVWQRHVTALEDPGLRDPALRLADSTTRLQTVWQVKAIRDVGSRSCDDLLDGLRAERSDGRLTATAEEYRGLENRLYRVEIHDGGQADEATFKWSRDNASTAVAIADLRVAGRVGRAAVEALPSSSDLPVAAGDVVEVAGDATELQGRPGTFATVIEADPKAGSLTIEGELEGHAGESGLKVRRWDGGPAKGLPLESLEAELEYGISVRFSSGSYATGDYWLIPARGATGAVHWPEKAPARRIRHAFCALALVEWRGRAPDEWLSVATDCRRALPALGEPSTSCTACGGELTQLRAEIKAQGEKIHRLERRLGS